MASGRPRARQIGLALGQMETGPLNAITDVPGVRVGQVTLWRGDGPLLPGWGPVRTGVTVVLPHQGNLLRQPVIGAVHTINGFGKATGFEQVRELGVIETPLALTNTLNVGRVWDALVDWTLASNPGVGIDLPTVNPVVGECNDGFLNDIQGRHVTTAHVLQALGEASDGLIGEGAVGAGTGMTCFQFKGGVGTSSRRLAGFTLGALVVANFGRRAQLSIAGAPVGLALHSWPEAGRREDGSIMVVLATDAPLTARQVERVAHRAAHGLARTGSVAGHGSGDFVVAFSTARHREIPAPTARLSMECLAEGELEPLFQAAVESTEESVVNALLGAETVVGRDGHMSHALPLEPLVAILQRYGHPEVRIP